LLCADIVTAGQDEIKQMNLKLNLATATLAGGTIGGYAVLLGGAAVFAAVTNMYGTADNIHDPLSTWMIVWKVPLGSLIGSGLGAYFVRRRDRISFASLIFPSLLGAILSIFCILPLSIVVLVAASEAIFGR
jgi:hypothetical protein